MKYKIDKRKNNRLNIEILLEGNERHEQFLLPLESCRNGDCHCSSREAEKLKGMKIFMEDKKIQLHMIPQDGMSFNEGVISGCIESISN